MATFGSSATASIPHSFIRLETKPTASLAYSFIPEKGSSSQNNSLIIFLNGLGLPASSWYPTIALLTRRPSHPAILAYDRFGQGFTRDRDPLDAGADDPAHAHDCMDVVRDLRQLLLQMVAQYQLAPGTGIFFVGNSVGCAIARLFAQTYSHTVCALVLLDSVMANSDMVSIYPNPDSPDFEREHLPLPEGVTAEGLREVRAKMDRIFSPIHGIMGNAEGLTRRNLAELLPYSDHPILTGVANESPWLTVVGHGFKKFAEDSLRDLGTPVAITNNYMNPYWHKYNLGLSKITCHRRSKGPVQSDKCGHFIQRDDPEFVLNQIVEILLKMA